MYRTHRRIHVMVACSWCSCVTRRSSVACGVVRSCYARVSCKRHATAPRGQIGKTTRLEDHLFRHCFTRALPTRAANTDDRRTHAQAPSSTHQPVLHRLRNRRDDWMCSNSFCWNCKTCTDIATRGLTNTENKTRGLRILSIG